MKLLPGTDPVVAELRGLEPLFHRLPPRASPEVVSALPDPGFFEVGASGTVYRHDLVVEVVSARYAAGEDPDDTRWTVADFAVRQLGDGLYLVTYLLDQDGRTSRRSTLWERREGRFVVLYHQGTLSEV